MQAICNHCATPMLPDLASCHQCGAPLPFVLSSDDVETGEPRTGDELEIWTAWQYRQPPPDYAEGLDFLTQQRAERVRVSGSSAHYGFPQAGILRYLAVGGGRGRVVFALNVLPSCVLARDEVMLPFSIVITPLMLQCTGTLVRLELEFLSKDPPSFLRLRYDVTYVPVDRRDWDRIGRRA